MGRSLGTSGKFTYFPFIFINYLLFNLLCIVLYKIISTEQLHRLIMLSKYLKHCNSFLHIYVMTTDNNA
jgi:hypothetical protein